MEDRSRSLSLGPWARLGQSNAFSIQSNDGRPLVWASVRPYKFRRQLDLLLTTPFLTLTSDPTQLGNRVNKERVDAEQMAID